MSGRIRCRWLVVVALSLDVLMTPLKYVLIIVVLLGPYALSFLSYLLPTLSRWLIAISLACWIPLFFFSLSALLRRKWKAAAIFSITWVLASLPFIQIEPVTEIRFWLFLQGFRIHASPVEGYLSKCRLTEFIEKGVKQKVGECEASGSSDTIVYVVFYDTTGELALCLAGDARRRNKRLVPVSQRTAEWKDAMWDYPPRGVLRDGSDRAAPLFENFYLVAILSEEFEG